MQKGPDNIRSAEQSEELQRLKSAHFTESGREQRITRAQTALAGPQPSFQLSTYAWKAIAEDPEVEQP
jgi:hypothetical protein